VRIGILVLASFGFLLSGVAAADTIAVPDDHATIQAAVDAAADGDEILVTGGTYPENVRIENRKDLTIRGKKDPVLDAEGSGFGVRIVGGEGVQIRGLTILNAGQDGVRVEGSDRVTLRDLTIRNAGGDGIFVSVLLSETSDGATITGNAIADVEGGTGSTPTASTT
jgi:polygalacturonase